MENLGQAYAKILNPHLISIQNNLAPSMQIFNDMQKYLAPAARITEQMNPMIKSVASLAEFASPLTNYDFMNSNVMRASEESKRSIAQAVENSILRYIQPLNLPNLNLSNRHIANQIIGNMPKPYFSDITKMIKPPTFDMSKYDFRIGVATQELENVVADEPEVVAKKLFFKDTSNPSNEFEANFFDILNEYREVLYDYKELLKEINATKNKDVTEKPSNEKHDSPAFYKDKMWYAEVIVSNILGLMISDFFSKTIGADPTNTIGFVLLLSCLVRFIKSKP